MTARLLIVGGSSPLGRAVVDPLARSGSEIITTSRAGPGVHLDVRDDRAMRDIVDAVRPHGVVYLASPPPADLEDAALAADLDTALARFAAHSAASGAVAFVYASSGAVYGTAAGVSPFREDGQEDGESGYARSKRAGERTLAGLNPQRMTVSALRYFNLYGAGFRRSLLNRLADPIERPALQLSEGFVRDYVHAYDAAAATLAALRRPPGGGFRAFNVGTGRGTDNMRLTELVPPTAYNPAAAGPNSFSVADTTRARRELRFAAHITVEEALADPTRFGLTTG